jgi:hypothetical protein
MSSPVPPAANQASALGYDPEWARRVQKKLGDVGDLSDPQNAAYANRKLRKMRNAATAPATTPPATTPTTPPTETRPPAPGPVGTPGEIIDPWGPGSSGGPGSNQVTGGAFLPPQSLTRLGQWPPPNAQKQAGQLFKPAPGGVVYY